LKRPRGRHARATVSSRSSRQGIYRRLAILGITASLIVGLATLIPSDVRLQTALVSEAGATTFALSAEQGFSFSPSEISNVATGVNVTGQVTDADTTGTAHTFTIMSVQGVVLPTTTDIATYLAAHPAMATVNLTSPGVTYPVTFKAPATGWYEFVCQEPGHFAQGMFGFIAFGEALPANLSTAAPNESPGAAVFIIIGTIVSLVVIALVLGFVVGRRRGAVYEMPPERLGYPEPELPPAPGAPPVMPPPPKG
jgi:uncharacterized cupredoxin-like copper-binding protein